MINRQTKNRYSEEQFVQELNEETKMDNIDFTLPDNNEE